MFQFPNINVFIAWTICLFAPLILELTQPNEESVLSSYQYYVGGNQRIFCYPNMHNFEPQTDHIPRQLPTDMLEYSVIQICKILSPRLIASLGNSALWMLDTRRGRAHERRRISRQRIKVNFTESYRRITVEWEKVHGQARRMRQVVWRRTGEEGVKTLIGRGKKRMRHGCLLLCLPVHVGRQWTPVDCRRKGAFRRKVTLPPQLL